MATDDGGEQEQRIAAEVERATQVLEKELILTFELDNEHQKKFSAVSLYSDDEEGSDDGSLESGIESLRILQSELNEAEQGPPGFSEEKFIDVVSSEDDEDDYNEDEEEYIIHRDDNDDPVHDQLPSVEEYKSSQKITSKSNVSAAATTLLRGFRRPDPPSSASLSASYIDVSTSEQDNILPQSHMDWGSLLPSVEEYKTSASIRTRKPPGRVAQGKQMTMGRCCIIMVILVLILVTIAIIVPAIFIAENKSRFEEVVKFISDKKLSTLDDLNKEGSPQFKAALWIADQDRRRVRIADTHAFMDRYVMAVLFYSFGGDRTWPDDLNFLSQAHICDWYKTYETDQNDFSARGVNVCREYNNELVPVSISLSFHGLSGGKLPDEIRRLSDLETLILQFNPTLGGALPSAILSLTNLKTLSVQHCSLVGTIPDWVGNMTSLTSLGLGDNRLTGSVPESLFQLTDIEILGLDDNFLKADLRRFGALTNLRSLYLDGNIIEGELTAAMLDGWEEMVELDLSENLISSTIPGRIFSHKTLRTLDLHGNRLSGKIPEVLVESNDALEFLALQGNELGPTIPSSIASLRGLQHLDLSQNTLTSTIPTELETMQDLRYLFLGDNDYNFGPFPTTIHQLDNLKELSLPNSGISGTIPATIGFLSSLIYLDLSGNSMEGTIPEAVSFLSNLRFLFLKQNNFHGGLPDDFDRLSNLDVLLLDGNNFTGSADPICMHTAKFNITYFASDCVKGGTSSDSSQFQCECCSICCGGETPTCYDGFWSAMIDPTWETGYKRTTYDFGEGRLNIP